MKPFYLIPKGLASLATKSAIKEVEENLKQAAHKAEHIIQEAESMKEKLEALTLKVETLAGVDGKLFGSVTPLMIGNQLKEEGFDIDRKRIGISGDIKETGTYEIVIDLHKEVKATVNLEVVAKEG